MVYLVFCMKLMFCCMNWLYSLTWQHAFYLSCMRHVSIILVLHVLYTYTSYHWRDSRLVSCTLSIGNPGEMSKVIIITFTVFQLCTSWVRMTSNHLTCWIEICWNNNGGLTKKSDHLIVTSFKPLEQLKRCENCQTKG